MRIARKWSARESPTACFHHGDTIVAARHLRQTLLILENWPFTPHIIAISTRKLGTFILDTTTRVVAESVFDRNKRREAEINEALKEEDARREAAVKNMLRLRALRLERDAKLKKQ
jgi:hypothetical protein